MCEPFQLDPAMPVDVSPQIERINRQLIAGGFEAPIVELLHPPGSLELTWQKISNLRYGWALDTGWRQAVSRRYPDIDPREIDLSVAVISADTTRRLLRFVFPRPYARTVSVKHADRPGAMQVIAQILATKHFNILSLLNRRGSTTAGMAEIVAAVEPSIDMTEGEVDFSLGDAWREVPAHLKADWSVHRAQDPEMVIYPRRPGDNIARTPPTLMPLVHEELRQLRGKPGLFVSRRFLAHDDPGADEIIHFVRTLISEHGFEPMEALPEPGATVASSDAVKAKMWAATAAVMVVLSTGDTQEFTNNLAHELGFMQGQSKSICVLAESGIEQALQRNANFQGLQLTPFSRQSAIGRTGANSLFQRLTGFLLKLRGVA